MSASNKKKLRKEQQQTSMSKKQQEAKKEARKLAAYTATFWIVLALCVSIVLGIVLKTPIDVAIDRLGTAVTVGDHKITTTELTYFYIDAINQWYGTYGSYATMFGLDPNKGLDQQEYDKEKGLTWADYFLDLALDNAKNTYALCDAAEAEGFKLNDEQQGNVDKLYDDLKADAKAEKQSVTKFLQDIYGKSANESSYKKYYEATVLASAYYNHHQETLKDSYTADQLRAFEGTEGYKYDSYTYATYYLNLEDFKMGGTKGSNGKITYSEDELKAAKEYLENVKNTLSKSDINTLELLNKAIEEMDAQLQKDKADNPAKEESKPESKPESGDTETKPETGDTDTETGDTETGDTETGNTETGNTETGNTETGNTETGDTETGDTETGNTETGDTETGDTETDDSETDDSDSEDKKDEEDKEDDDKKEDEKEPPKATENKKVLYEKVSALMQEWMRDSSRKAGDITALADETTSKDADGKETKTLKGYYIVLFQEHHDNQYPLINVRHILVSFEGGTYNSSTGSTTYSDAEKKAAKEKAEKLLAEWKSGAATEDSFAEMANKHSADGGGTTGGLYENVYPGQMVTNFNDWCFDESRKEGDTGVVESTYGYHVMYFVGDGDETYRDYMVTNDLLEKDMTAWQEGLIAGITLEEKNLDRIDKDLILNGGASSAVDGDHAGHNH